VIASLACEDIKTADMQAVVNAAPTAKEGARLRRCISALVGAGITGGYSGEPAAQAGALAGRRPPGTGAAGKHRGRIRAVRRPRRDPRPADVARRGHALAALQEVYELMACFAAYTGLRWGELAAMTTGQIDAVARVVTVDRKVIEVGGQLYAEAPKGRKSRRTMYPCRTPAGYPLAEKVAARIEQARAGQEAGTNPQRLMFASPGGKHWRSSNFARRVLAPAYLAVGWRDAGGNGTWVWHSLRHVFCTTALFTWKMDAADVSRLARHASIRITLDMYVGATAGTLDRARTATE
jgi:integrase